MVMLGELVFGVQNLGATLPFRLVLLGIIAAFYLWFWTHGGQTLGMRAWRLQVQQDDGSALSLTQASLRLVTGFLSCLTLGLGICWLWFDKADKTLHDRLAGTRLVLLEKQR